METTPRCTTAMKKFSIIIPAIGEQRRIDETLVAILESRPDGAEILVACDDSYVDPYDLDDEVQFVRLEPNGDRDLSDWRRLQNVALRQATGDYICALHPGVVMLPGWDQTVLPAFAERTNVASVIPSVQSSRGQTVGVTFTGGGRRVSQKLEELERPRGFASAPSYSIGFFQNSAIQALGGWNTSIHSDLSDIELGLRLARAGYDCRVAVNCHALETNHCRLRRESAYRLARDSQRLLREVIGEETGLTTLQPISLLVDMAAGSPIARLMGRLAGCRGDLPQHEQRQTFKAA